MEIDFHFGVTYVVSRIAGLDHNQAQTVATCSQYVDDTVNAGVLNFKTGEAYYRIRTAHDTLDYRMWNKIEERRVWVPFHFLPGNRQLGAHKNDYYNRIVCRPNSEIAQAMVQNCIMKQDRPFGLHQLGITAHVFVDTWAHQGFAGINHPVNIVKDIKLNHPPDRKTFCKTWKEVGFWTALIHKLQPIVCDLIDRWFPMGHGAALHYPDHPFRQWTYKNGQGEVINRNNPKDFLEAADELCKFIQRFVKKDPDAFVPGLPSADKNLIEKMLTEIVEEDGVKRNETWLLAIKKGEFSFGPSSPYYCDSGPGSWKFEALGTVNAKINSCDKFNFKKEFLSSDWKLFHDAAKAHQYEMLTEVLPQFGISAV
ncbi:MAG: DUF6765 family protein [Pseudobdellovibrionaceae bacterium]